jgi:formiminotetrahydrofolate cyclodeaminase
VSPSPADPPGAQDPGRPGPPDQPPGPPDQPPGPLDQPLGEFLDSLAAGHAAPGGGAAAALAVALGASLCAMAARLSVGQLSERDAGLLAASADGLRHRAASLIQADAESYQSVIAALRDQPDPGRDPARHIPGPAIVPASNASGPAAEPASDGPGQAAGHRRQRIDAALSRAADVPMAVVEIAAQAARDAARLAADGNPRLRGDAITAALLAQAGARAAATLISINLAAAALADSPAAIGPADDRPARAQALLTEISRAVVSVST